MNFPLLRLIPLVLFIAGCASGVVYNGRGDTGLREVETIRATAKVEIREEDERLLKGRAVVVAAWPGLFRIEVLGLFNQTVFILASDGEKISLLSVRDQVLYTWPVGESPYPFLGRDLAAYLVGRVPESSLDIQGKGISIDKTEEGFIKSITRHVGGTPLLEVAMDKYRRVSSLNIPYSITLTGERGSMGISYSDVELNVGVDSKDFTLVAPPGYKEIHGVEYRVIPGPS